jgi:hypothetical protein
MSEDKVNVHCYLSKHKSYRIYISMTMMMKTKS